MRWRIRAVRHRGDPAPEQTHQEARGRNLFETAADYVVACVRDDDAAMEEAAQRVDPGALMFGVSELARRAVVALAADRDTTPEAVARALLGLPAGRPSARRS